MSELSRLRAKKIREHLAELIGHHKSLFAFVIAMLAIQALTALLIAPAFADVSPGLSGYAASAQKGHEPIQLAQADLSRGVGSIDDYMHQSRDGPTTAPSSPAYSSRPSFRYASQPSLAQEWNNANPKTQRDLLIGAAVVGAIALGLYAYHQHQQYEARRHYRHRFYGPSRGLPY